MAISVKFGARTLGALHGALCNFDFAVVRTSRQIFDGMAVIVARGEVHFAEIASAAQHVIHQADALEKCFPVERGGEPHAGDDVAHGHAHGGLLLMLGADDFIRGSSLRGKAFVQPDQNWADLGIEVAQTLHQLHGKRALQWLIFETAQHSGGRNGRLAGGAEHAISKNIGFHARVAAAYDALGDAPQIFHQHDAQRDSYGPEFADGQRLHALVGADEAAQDFGIETAVVVRHKRPRNPENARKALQVAGSEFRQFAVKAGRKIVANFAQLLFDDEEIIYEPFRRGSDGLFVLNGARGGAVIFQQDAAVLEHSRDEWPSFFGIGDDELGCREAFRVLLQALDAEKLSANGLLWLGENRRGWLSCLCHLLALILHSILRVLPETCALRIPARSMKQRVTRPARGIGRVTRASRRCVVEFYRTMRAIER